MKGKDKMGSPSPGPNFKENLQALTFGFVPSALSLWCRGQAYSRSWCVWRTRRKTMSAETEQNFEDNVPKPKSW